MSEHLLLTILIILLLIYAFGGFAYRTWYIPPGQPCPPYAGPHLNLAAVVIIIVLVLLLL